MASEKPPLTPTSGDGPSSPDVDVYLRSVGMPPRGESVRETIVRSIREAEGSKGVSTPQESKSTVSEGQPPQTADNAVRAFILLFALGFVLRGIDVMDHAMSDAVQKWLIAAGITVFDYFYVPIRTALGPRFASTAAKVGTDFRWWVAAIFLLLLWSVASPSIEQHRWPFLVQQLPSPPVVVHEAPTAEDIAKATAAIQKQLENMTRQRDAAIQEVNRLRQIQQSLPLPVAPSATQPYEISDSKIRELADELFEIKGLLPAQIQILRIMYDGPSLGLGFQIGKAFDLAGIVPRYDWSRPYTPRDSGIRIRVGDIQAIPDGAKKVAQLLKKIANLNSHFETQNGLDPKTFVVFIGPQP